MIPFLQFFNDLQRHSMVISNLTSFIRPGIKELRGEILDAMTDTVHRMSPEVMARTLSGEAGS